MESQENSSFPANDHEAILHKMNKKSKTKKKRMNTNNWNIKTKTKAPHGNGQ